MNKPVIDQLVDRFLSCPLPQSVKADPCACNPDHPHRTGTNLLTHSEAKEMLGKVLGNVLEEARLQDAEDGVWVHLHAGSQYFSINLSNNPMARKFCLAYHASRQPKA